ncbi:hypothetical protein OSB04_008535 [Centaurea solstitialis]|uniref:Uncharacterized protein n=1 Tax=Centaurea solstitialis TaxID=347529 RepID=A0AA38WRH1_9ASTR|nr:hypothetical protein OSB04_008535 [Centaurea solstitialis]
MVAAGGGGDRWWQEAVVVVNDVGRRRWWWPTAVAGGDASRLSTGKEINVSTWACGWQTRLARKQLIRGRLGAQSIVVDGNLGPNKFCLAQKSCTNFSSEVGRLEAKRNATATTKPLYLCGVPSRHRWRATLPVSATMLSLFPCGLHRHVASIAIQMPFMSKSDPSPSSSSEAERAWVFLFVYLLLHKSYSRED